MSNNHRRAVVAVLLTSALAIPLALLASHSWGNYHWGRTSNPFTIKLGDNVSSQWDSALNTASNDWSQSTVLDTVIVPGGTRPKNCRPTSGRVEVCNARYGNNGWLGIAQIWASGSHITQGVVKNNDTYFNTSTYNTPAWRNLVMCQEIGHTFGLDHQDEDFDNVPLGTCMDYFSDPNPNQHPNAHDYQQLQTIYQHLDSVTTVGNSVPNAQTPPAMNQIDFDTPAQWGRSIRGSREQGKELFELDFGGGHKVFTWVIWVKEHGQGRE